MDHSIAYGSRCPVDRIWTRRGSISWLPPQHGSGCSVVRAGRVGCSRSPHRVTHRAGGAGASRGRFLPPFLCGAAMPSAPASPYTDRVRRFVTRPRCRSWSKRLLQSLSATAGACVVLGLAACASRPRPRLTEHSANATWLRLESRHFTLSTDFAAKTALEALNAYESEFDALSVAAFGRLDALDLHTHVVLFQDRREFASHVDGSITVGVFYDQLAFDIEPEATILTYGEATKVARFRFRHELAHRFMRASLGALPPWLDEGLACYYSNIDVEDGQLVLGRQDLLRRFTESRDWRPVNHNTHLLTEIPIAEVPDATEIMALPDRAFYPAHVGELPTYDAEKQETIHYAAAWGLVHMLLNGPAPYRERFSEAMAAAAQGESMAVALTRELAEVRGARLDREFRWYLRDRTRAVWMTPYVARHDRPSENRRMTPAEVLVLRARLASEAGPALSDLHRAVEQAPRHADAHHWLGVIQVQRGQTELGREYLRQALAIAPDEPRYLNGLAWTYGLESETLAGDEPELVDVMSRLQRQAATPAQFDTVAWYLAGRGRIAEAAAAAREAIALDPNCWRCLDTYARILYSAGAVETAEMSQRTAVNRLPRWVPESLEQEFVTRWARYRDAAVRDGSTSAWPSPTRSGVGASFD
ncbi:MAG: tetratricopeptide repeat protein [Myxococcales bacterium FL481]|nr:MAG: tetratricopeptide repeat protein [Myxococcales bacterium FL481]